MCRVVVISTLLACIAQHLSNAYAVEQLELDDDDALLLSRLCLDNESLLGEMEQNDKVAIRFEPLEGQVYIRGEDSHLASRNLRELLKCVLACPLPPVLTRSVALQPFLLPPPRQRCTASSPPQARTPERGAGAG